MSYSEREVPGIWPGNGLTINVPWGTLVIKQFFDVRPGPVPTEEGMEAQARLFTAAADLLETAKHLLRFQDDEQNFACEGDEDTFHNGWDEAYEELRKAIAKAEGQS